MDITTDFGSVILGSNPGRRTARKPLETKVSRGFPYTLCAYQDSNGTFAPLVQAKVRGSGGVLFLYRLATETKWRKKNPNKV